MIDDVKKQIYVLVNEKKEEMAVVATRKEARELKTPGDRIIQYVATKQVR